MSVSSTHILCFSTNCLQGDPRLSSETCANHSQLVKNYVQALKQKNNVQNLKKEEKLKNKMISTNEELCSSYEEEKLKNLWQTYS